MKGILLCKKMVAQKNSLSDLPKKLLRFQWRWHRRSSSITSRKLDYLKDPGHRHYSALSDLLLSARRSGLWYFGLTSTHAGTMDEICTVWSRRPKNVIGILMFLVTDQCSDEHEWFKSLRRSGWRVRKVFLYWRLSWWKLPCNWRSYFGGSTGSRPRAIRTNITCICSTKTAGSELGKSKTARWNLQDDQLVAR